MSSPYLSDRERQRAQAGSNPESRRGSAIRHRIPGATYRLQFNSHFKFEQAAEIAEYLKRLGISDVYASPLFQAGPASTHGYDICSFGKLNPSLGGMEEFERFSTRLRELEMGTLLDMVPNHMAATMTNSWWADVLEHGRASKFAEFFDINWQPANPSLHGKVLLPVLEDRYARVLESGKLRLEFAEGKFCVAYHDHRFPLASASLPPAARNDPDRLVRETTGAVGDQRSFDRLDAILQQQHYRLAYWRVGPDEINYRRFFDITELVALRMDRPEVFEATHAVLFDLLQDGKVSGLRIDHPDGLRDPRQYFERLQSRAAERIGVQLASTVPTSARDATCSSPDQCVAPERELYVVAEKILSSGETLPEDWPVDGTTGYDFLNRVNGLFVNSRNEEALDQTYREFAGADSTFDDCMRQGRRWVLENSFRSEFAELERALHQVAALTRRGSDLTLRELSAALQQVIVGFPIYRTYLTRDSTQPSTQDRNAIEKALADAKRVAPEADPAGFDFLKAVLLLDIAGFEPPAAELARQFVIKFQQLTAPVMAKGMEDTAFYIYHRLVSLNEVGGNPGKFGTSLEEFHNTTASVASRWPHTLLATATHDTKRGEDARARINVLSELPTEWRQAVKRWRDLNADKKSAAGGKPLPHANDEYFLYQSMIGAWPFESNDPKALGVFRERFCAYALKAAREAKGNTSWTHPDPTYEKALEEFATRILDPQKSARFLEDFKAFHGRVAFFGRFNSLAQMLIKITAPGVPDFYQGTELWDLNFVDPDNRRPIDYDLRRRMLDNLEAKSSNFVADVSPLLSGLVENIHSAEMKLFMIWKALGVRRQHQDVFKHGSYDPLPAFGLKKSHVCAFSRRWGEESILTVAPRLSCGLTGGTERPPIGPAVWDETILPLPVAKPGDSFQNAFTRENVQVIDRAGVLGLEMSDVLRQFPVALLVRRAESDPVGAEASDA